MRIIIRSLTAAGLLASVSCGSAVRTGSASVFLALDSIGGIRGSANAAAGGTGASVLISDVQTLVTTGGQCTVASPCRTVFGDNGVASLRIVPKDVTSSTGPSSNNDVTINRVHVEYRRTDGRGVPGVDVPFPFDTFVTATITAGSATQVGFELVRVQAKLESPLVQLVATPPLPPVVIGAVCDVTFYGQDRAGNNVSVTGSIQAEFSDWGDF